MGIESSADSGVTTFLNAGDDLQVPLDRITELGDKVLRPKEHIGNTVTVRWTLDTEGNRIGLHSPN